jgi:hypothetical protein
MKRLVSVSGELHVLMKAVAGIRALAARSIDSPDDSETLALSISSLLVLVEERLRLVDRATRDAIDPSLAWCQVNAAIPTTEGDLVLVGWSEKKQASRARREWKHARRRGRLREGETRTKNR